MLPATNLRGQHMIHFHCPNCSKKVTVADEHAGKRGKCPKCQQVVIIPSLKKEEPSPLHEALSDQRRKGDYGVTELTKPCPFCSELILDAASKCKHCGEWLGAERMVRKTTAGRAIKDKSSRRLFTKKRVGLALFLCVVIGGLWVWHTGPESTLEPEFLIRWDFEKVAQEKLIESKRRWNQALLNTTAGLNTNQESGSDEAWVDKYGEPITSDHDYSRYKVARVEAERMTDSETHDAIGRAYWTDEKHPEAGEQGPFELVRRISDRTWREPDYETELMPDSTDQIEGAPADGAIVSPETMVAEFENFLGRLTGPSTDLPAELNAATGWGPRAKVTHITDVRYDVIKTDSVVHPYKASCSFDAQGPYMGGFKVKIDFGYEDSRWVLIGGERSLYTIQGPDPWETLTSTLTRPIISAVNKSQ